MVGGLRRVTELGGNLSAVYVLSLTAAWLWLRQQPRLAAYLATTGWSRLRRAGRAGG